MIDNLDKCQCPPVGLGDDNIIRFNFSGTVSPDIQRICSVTTGIIGTLIFQKPIIVSNLKTLNEQDIGIELGIKTEQPGFDHDFYLHSMGFIFL
jgi:hypothetical protein